MCKKASVYLTMLKDIKSLEYNLTFTIIIDGIVIAFKKPLILLDDELNADLGYINLPTIKTISGALENKRALLESHINKNKYINSNSPIIKEIVRDIRHLVEDIINIERDNIIAKNIADEINELDIN